MDSPFLDKKIVLENEHAFSIYDATPIPSSYKHIQALNQNSEQILQNYELMDLITYCDDAIGVENVLDIGRILNAA